MNQRIGGDYSLNAPRTIESSDGDWQEVLVDEKSVNQETYVAEKEELEKRKSMLGSALSLLSERERKIFSYRRLTDDPKTLEELSKEYNVSRERIRQIEVKAFEKVQAAVKSISKSENNLAIEDKKVIHNIIFFFLIVSDTILISCFFLYAISLNFLFKTYEIVFDTPPEPSIKA